MVKQSKLAVTGAHYGLKDWLVQRVTAVLMTLYLILLAGVLFVAAPYDYAALKSIFSHQWMRIATFVFFTALLWLAWIGVRNVLMDYVHAAAVRLTLQIAVITVLLFYWVWIAEILWG